MSPRSPSPDAVTALRRFGLGPRPGDVAQIASDPRGYVQEQTGKPAAAVLAESSSLEPSHKLLVEFREMRLMRAVMRTFGTDSAGRPGAQRQDGASRPAAALGAGGRRIVVTEAGARISKALSTDAPLVERLVYFWSNHFTVAVRKGPVRMIAGAFEREAIRPHVLGRFTDMLKAVARHPAMLIYLDNVQSIGPGSRAGQRQAAAGRNRGLNENLAREILELHTLGADGGYGQADVTGFARALTGWSVARGIDAAPDKAGRFEFAQNRHEPGPFSVLGRTYRQPGQDAGLAILDDLARHPSTARHVARKLARHFVSDDPPAGLVARMETAFRTSDGDLAAVVRALVTAPEAWERTAAKIIPPYDFLVSLQRSFATTQPPAECVRLCQILGQPMWNATSPKGWPEDDDAWISPSPIRERLRIAESVARTSPVGDPRVLLADLTGGTAGDATRQAVERAESRTQAIELMIMSPEFMRR